MFDMLKTKTKRKKKAAVPHAALIRQHVAKAKREIKADAKADRIPFAARDFSHLHDFVDANDYGYPDVDLPHEEWVALINAIQNEVDAWIKGGNLARAEPAAQKRAPRLSAPKKPTEDDVREAAKALGYKQEGVSSDWISWAYELRPEAAAKRGGITRGNPGYFLVHDEDEDTWVKARRYALEGTRAAPSYPSATRTTMARYRSQFDGINDVVILDKKGIGHADAIKILTLNKKRRK